MTNTADTRHPLFITLCLIAQRKGMNVDWYPGTALAYQAIFTTTIDGLFYYVSLNQRHDGALFYTRAISRSDGGDYYRELDKAVPIVPGNCSLSDFLAKLRVPVAEQGEADSIAAQHESWELSEVEAYWPTDMANWPLAEVFPPADPEFAN